MNMDQEMCDESDDPRSVDGAVGDIIAAVADREGIDEVDIDPPLADVLDPDALDRLIRESDSPTNVSFEYREWDIEVQSDGTISIRELPDEGNLYRAVCQTCGKRTIHEGLAGAQDFFDSHADRGHEVGIERLSVRDFDG